MRLVCPNCAAQYNVDDRVIPPGGRDVQCSNCGQTWFQTGAERPRVRPAGTPPPAGVTEGVEPSGPAPAEEPRAPAAEPAPPASPPPSPAPAPAGAPDRAPAPMPEPSAVRALPVLEDDGDWEDDEPADHLPPASAGGIGPAPRPPAPGGEGPVQGRRVLDEAVLAILREEAEREARARRAEAQGMETQGELGLPPPAPVPGRAASEPPRPPEAEELPDARQINSTLAARDAAETEGAEPAAARQRSGFRLGFALMLLLAVLALALYLFAPQVSAAVPALAEPLAGYVAAVDAARLWLERVVAGAAGGT